MKTVYTDKQGVVMVNLPPLIDDIVHYFGQKFTIWIEKQPMWVVCTLMMLPWVAIHVLYTHYY